MRTSFAYAMALRLLQAGGLDFATELDGIAGNVRTDLSSSQVIDLANAFRPLGEATVYAAYVPGSESEQDGTALFKASDSQWKTVMESVDAGADSERRRRGGDGEQIPLASRLRSATAAASPASGRRWRDPRQRGIHHRDHRQRHRCRYL